MSLQIKVFLKFIWGAHGGHTFSMGGTPPPFGRPVATPLSECKKSHIAKNNVLYKVIPHQFIPFITDSRCEWRNLLLYGYFNAPSLIHIYLECIIWLYTRPAVPELSHGFMTVTYFNSLYGA